MPWQKVDLETWAEELGVNLYELRQKDLLIAQIITARKTLGLTQTQLAHLVNVSQPRIAQIESRVKIGSIKFDVLLNILTALGYEFQITTRKIKPGLSVAK
jgi:predicted transcriptional regulator